MEHTTLLEASAQKPSELVQVQVPEAQKSLFQNLKTYSDISNLLRMKSAKHLSWAIYRKNEEYRIVSIPKKSGGSRKLHDPSPGLRKAQHGILALLSQIELPEYIHGFQTGKGVISAALQHVQMGSVVSLDIKDFFPSIKVDLVAQILKGYGMGEAAAKAVSELCTYKVYLPQGAITSPKISSLVSAVTFGPAIAKFCEQRGYRLTVYADDITISIPSGPSKEEILSLSREVVAFVRGELNKYRFVVNRKKTKIMLPSTRQWVCGAVVNDKLNMKRDERLALRATVYNCETAGIEPCAARAQLDPHVFIRKVGGRLNWFTQLDPAKGTALNARFRRVSKAFLAANKMSAADIPELSWNSGIENLEVNE